MYWPIFDMVIVGALQSPTPMRDQLSIEVSSFTLFVLRPISGDKPW